MSSEAVRAAEAVWGAAGHTSHSVGGDDASMGRSAGGNAVVVSMESRRQRVALAVERPDSGTPRCPCGDFQVWVGGAVEWACPHCDGISETGSAND